MYLGHYQTMRLSFEQICQGADPWSALDGFVDDWYAYHLNERERLVHDALPERYPVEFQQWAAFCAASVRWFCATYEVPEPKWIDDPRYVLAEPWYLDAPLALWQQRRETTAEEFTQHNVYCGNRVYVNKYEVDVHGRPFRRHPVDLQERRALVRIAATRLQQVDREE